MSTLPEFSDDLAHCDACEWPDAGTSYVPAAELGEARRIQGRDWPKEAHLMRACTRCGYAWPEALAVPQRPDEDSR